MAPEHFLHKHIGVRMRVAICGTLLLAGARAQDPYSYLERMFTDLQHVQALHVRVSVEGSDAQGKECQREVYESYQTKDRMLSIQPGTEMLLTERTFVLVDKAAHTIQFDQGTAPKADRQAPTPDALAGLDSLRARWHKGTILAAPDSLARYRFTLDNGPIATVEIEVTKSDARLRHLRYVMRQDPGDGCPRIDLAYEVLETDPHLPDELFGIGRYLQRSPDGTWRPATAFKGYKVRQITG